ncbi:MAG: GTP 3',8-cyclase MoaA [Stenotrophobium sp.]
MTAPAILLPRQPLTAPGPWVELQGRVRDRQGRHKRKLRVSLTDRCNLRCPYCMPDTPQWLPRKQLLDRAELKRLITLFVTRLGITQLRLTGGEPLLRKDLEDCIADFSGLRTQGLERISLTTNGVLLARRARGLRAAGLDDINVSLDALDAAAFARMSGGHGDPAQVTAGVLAAREAGLPVKINMVVMRDFNEDEVLPLARWALDHAVPLRLIEFMPLDSGGRWNRERVVPAADMLKILGAAFEVEALPENDDPARYYRLDGRGMLGIISTISRPFCTRCDRLRLTATGELYACLFSANGHDLRSPLRAGTADAEIEAAIRRHVWFKEAGYAQTGYVERPITMHALGG